MKVAYLLGSLNRGGAETLILDVFRNADKANYGFIGIYRHGGDYERDFYATQRKLYHLQPKRWSFIHYLLNLRRILKREQITVVHAQMALDAIYAKWATIGLPIKIVLTFHGFDIGADKLTKLRNRIAVRYSDKICFVSEYEKRDYERKYSVGNKGYVIYNGIDFSKIAPIEGKIYNEQKKDNIIKLCCVGSFGAGRSQIVLCKALGILNDRGVKPDFCFIGAKRISEPQIFDECYSYCQKHNLKHVHFMGNRSDVYDLEQEMDGFVYSTKNDTFGIAVVEAMAAGLPVIVNDWKVMKEISKNGKWVTLFKTNDAEDCAEKIEELLNDLEARKIQARKIAAEVRAEYSIEKHIERLAEIYNEVINNQSVIKNQQ